MWITGFRLKNITDIRNDFPILSTKVYGKPLVYLDNGATTQKPQAVLDKVNEVNTTYNSPRGLPKNMKLPAKKSVALLMPERKKRLFLLQVQQVQLIPLHFHSGNDTSALVMRSLSAILNIMQI
jgi:hypothetical protein